MQRSKQFLQEKATQMPGVRDHLEGLFRDRAEVSAITISMGTYMYLLRKYYIESGRFDQHEAQKNRLSEVLTIEEGEKEDFEKIKNRYECINMAVRALDPNIPIDESMNQESKEAEPNVLFNLEIKPALEKAESRAKKQTPDQFENNTLIRAVFWFLTPIALVVLFSGLGGLAAISKAILGTALFNMVTATIGTILTSILITGLGAFVSGLLGGLALFVLVEKMIIPGTLGFLRRVACCQPLADCLQIDRIHFPTSTTQMRARMGNLPPSPTGTASDQDNFLDYFSADTANSSALSTQTHRQAASDTPTSSPRRRQ